MAEPGNLVECPDCKGTGSDEPDCWLCKGAMFIDVETALGEGYVLDDLDDDVDGGSCRCPACRASSCELCDGDGEVAPVVPAEEELRVLRFGLEERIPARITVPRHRPDVVYVERDALLSPSAGAACHKRGDIRWMQSILGDEVSLTRQGWRRVMALYDDGDPQFLANEKEFWW